MQTKDQGPSSPLSFNLTYTLTIPERTNRYQKLETIHPQAQICWKIWLYFISQENCLVFCT